MMTFRESVTGAVTDCHLFVNFACVVAVSLILRTNSDCNVAISSDRCICSMTFRKSVTGAVTDCNLFVNFASIVAVSLTLRTNFDCNIAISSDRFTTLGVC